MADWGKGNHISMAKYQRYRAFGTEDVSWASLNQAYRYTGKPVDEEKGIDQQYFGARYYQPILGRWLAVDPLRNKYPEWSLYVYCADNPMKYVDPDGKFVEPVSITTGTVIAGTALIAATGFTYSYATNEDIRKATNSFGEGLVKAVKDACESTIKSVTTLLSKYKEKNIPNPPRSEKQRSEETVKAKNKPPDGQPKDSPTRIKGEPPNPIDGAIKKQPIDPNTAEAPQNLNPNSSAIVIDDDHDKEADPEQTTHQ